MRNKRTVYFVLFIGSVLFLASMVTGCELNPRYIYENGAIMVGGDGEPIKIVNNPDADNPTYAELLAFLKADTTDSREYIEGSYVCADFAEDVHNNAEAAGIKAAWVGVDFEGDDKGHAINMFETTDNGPVYVDCTGSNARAFDDTITEALEQYGHDLPAESVSCDAIAYFEIGKEYGIINIDKAISLSYDFYEEYKENWRLLQTLITEYNREVTLYNQEIEGKVYYQGSPELARIEAWAALLEDKRQVIDELTEGLDDYWFEPLGIVEDVNIYWGG